MEKTGFYWKCGKELTSKSKDGLFCDDKHKEQYARAQERQIRRGKKEGYGIAGSTH